jgi:hypothetical protein
VGCDIHFYVEKLMPDGKWARCEEMVPDPYFENWKHLCRNCEEPIVFVGNPYTYLGVDSGSSDEEVFAAWNQLREDVGVEPTKDEGYDVEVRRLTALAQLDISYEAIKTSALRTLVPSGVPHPSAGFYHISALKECDRLPGDVATERSIMVRDRYYSGRDYDLFGILSGVRGDAPPGGSVCNDGVPDDSDPEIVKEFEAWGGDAHTESNATLAELNARFPWWTEKVVETAEIWLDSEDATERLGNVNQYSWMGENTLMVEKLSFIANDVLIREHVKGIKLYEDGELAFHNLGTKFPKLMDDLSKAGDPSAVWHHTIPKAVCSFSRFVQTMSRMASHVEEDGDMTSVRAVWWFDN